MYFIRCKEMKNASITMVKLVSIQDNLLVGQQNDQVEKKMSQHFGQQLSKSVQFSYAIPVYRNHIIASKAIK